MTLTLAVLVAVWLGTLPAEAEPQGPPVVDATAPSSAGKDASQEEQPDCKKLKLDDCRENFEAELFIGSAIDSFAARDLQLYLNPEDSGDTKSFQRLVGGVNFGYRLWGDTAVEGNKQLWVYGRTLHGVRSTDVDCDKNPDLAICGDDFVPTPNPADEFLFILRNATSLEGTLGFGYEFLQLQPEKHSSARLYVNAEYGFVTVSGDDDDAMDMTKVGIGVMATEGKYQGSYLELGIGESRVFERDSTGRIKIDGRVKWDFGKKPGTGISGLARISIDSDGGSGADSIQSYMGLLYTFSE